MTTLCCDPWPFEPKINRRRYCVEDKLTIMPSFKSFRSEVFVLSC